MDVFYSKVFSILDKGETVVLATEDAARSVLSEYVLSSSENPSRSAVRGDSVLSFDRFKELFYPSRAGKRAVDEASRMLFSAFLVEKNKENLPYFFPLSQNSVPDERMTAFISSMIKDLEDGLHYSYTPLKKDISFIYEEYVSFLEKCGLYEPAFIRYGFENNLRKKYHVAFSDADVHIADFLSKIEDRTNIEILSFDSIAPKELNVYDNEKQEIRSLFLEIRRLVEPSGGVDPSDIIISTPSYERILPYMEREAWLFSVPLVKMRGKSPLEYPAGMFFKSLSEIHDNNYSLEEMKKFFLNPSFPFASGLKVRDFILSAIERNVSYREDPDRFLFVRSSSVYRDLQHYLEGIYAAKSAKRLVNQIKSLLEKLLSPAQFNFPEDERLALEKAVEEEVDKRKKESLALQFRLRKNDEDVFSFIIRTLMAFSSSLESMEDAGFSYSGQLFPLFLKVLENTVYVPQDKGEGVRIYPLGQALGVKARHHFIAGLNEAESRCVLKRAPFLSDYETEGERECGDFTIPLLSSYYLGSDEVHLSASFELYTGSAIPLLDLETVRPSSKMMDSYADMSEINKEGLGGYEIYPVQKSGYERALLTSLDVPSRVEDLAEDMTMPLCSLNRKSWTFSYSQLDCYERCPYVYALRYIYGLDRVRKYDVEEYPAGEIGQRLHRVCELYIDSSSFDASSVVPGLLDGELDLWEKGMRVDRSGDLVQISPDVPMLTQQMRAYIVSRYRDNLVALLEGIKRPGCTFESEWKGSAGLDGILFEGFIDLLVQDPEGRFTIIDFKSSEPKGDTLQFDIYRLLLSSSLPDIDFSDPLYAIFSKGLVKKKSFLSDDERDKRIIDDVEGIEKGGFKAVNTYKSCQACRFKASCRRRYFVR